MIDAQLLVPDETYDEFRNLWEARVALYAGILARHGVRLEAARWTAARADWPALACMTWGYHLLAAEWDAFLSRWPGDVPIANPASVLRWNTDKGYLAELERTGLATVPTRFVGRADAAALAEARAAFGADELVVKPRVSGGAWRTERLGPGDPAPDLPEAMVQPFLPAVSGEGELSAFLIGGEYSHAMRKVAKPGDFRVQREHGGAFTPFEADAEMLATARAAVAAAPAPPAYARCDLIRLGDGRLAVMELEMIEPDLYLDLVPAAEDRFGAAVAGALRG
ncbi:MAG TPA: hypothetical protein VF636_00945 [Sphingomonas sp.]|jgi:hypothetical protein